MSSATNLLAHFDLKAQSASGLFLDSNMGRLAGIDCPRREHIRMVVQHV